MATDGKCTCCGRRNYLGLTAVARLVGNRVVVAETLDERRHILELNLGMLRRRARTGRCERCEAEAVATAAVAGLRRL